MMITAAALISAWADAALHYSTSGSLVSLGLLGVEAAGALALLFISWILLAGQPVGAAFLSSIRTLSIAGANGLILLAAGGWVLGGIGLATGGPIQVGWLTAGATVVLVVATFRSRARARRPVTLPVNKAIL